MTDKQRYYGCHSIHGRGIRDTLPVMTERVIVEEGNVFVARTLVRHITNTASRECRYDRSQVDAQCGGCQEVAREGLSK